MKELIRLILPIFWLSVILTSCSVAPPLPEITATQTQEKATATVASTATFAQPIATAIFTSTAPPTQTAVPTLSASDIAFWENTLPLSDEISLTEYSLSPGTDPVHQDSLFLQLPEEAWWPRSSATDVPTAPIVRMEDLGYSWKTIDPKDQCNKELARGTKSECKYQLYKGQKLLLETAFIVHVSQVYRFLAKSGSIHAFVVTVAKNGGRDNFLIHNGTVVAWGQEDYANATRPIVYQDDFLWVRLRPDYQVDVQKSNGEIIFTTHPKVYSIKIPRPRLREWNGHWVLEVENIVAVDGEELNKKLGFEQIFRWNLVNGKPAYFFQRGPRYGISYGGQILALQYDDIAHGMCCSPAQNNPGIAYDSARFFGKRDGVWRYVVVKFK